MLEIAPVGDGLFKQSFAGDTFNSAVYLARQFSDELEVSYITGLGNDAFSHKMVAAFEEEKIRTDAIQIIADRSLGLYLIENDTSGERFFHYWRSASAARYMFDGWTPSEIATLLSNYECLYLSGISLAILDETQRQNLIEALHTVKQDCFIAYDPNYRANLWPDTDACRQTNKQLAQLADIALISKEDHVALWDTASSGTIAAEWASWGAKEVVVKDGGAECLILKDEKETRVSPQSNITPVDTTGAGDSFAAGYVGSRLLEQSPIQAATTAHSIAAKVIQHRGAIIACNK